MRDDTTRHGADWTFAELDAEGVGCEGVGPPREPLDPVLGELHMIAVDPLRWRQVFRELMAHALGRLG